VLNFNPDNYVYLNIDHLGHIYVSGNDVNTGKFYIAKVESNGTPDGIVMSSSTTSFFQTLDANDNFIIRGVHSGSADVDPTSSVLRLPTRTAAQLGAGMSDGYILRIDTFGLDAADPLKFLDNDGEIVTVSLTGSGSAHYNLFGNAPSFSDLDNLELFNTNSGTTLSITTAGSGYLRAAYFHTRCAAKHG